MSMNMRSWRSVTWVVMAMTLPLFYPSAKATGTPVTFSCSPCTGTVSFTSGASTTGIPVKDVVGPTDDVNKTFLLTFDTSSSVATLTEQGTLSPIHPDARAVLTGIIQHALINPPTGPGTISGVTLTVVFNSLPLDFQQFLGTTDGSGLVSTFELTGNAVTTASAVISPTPEAGSYLLMGTGMLLIGLFLRYKGNSQATPVVA